MITSNKLKKFLLLPVFALLSLQVLGQNNVVPDNVELAALKNIYDSLGGSGWTTKTNWPTLATWPASATSSQFGTWFGITVTNGDITKISLPSNNLTGQLPKTVSSLTKLQYIYIGSNSIGGSIPSSYGNLTNLLHITAESNNLSGSIPTTIGNLTNLTKLKLNNNSLSGSIPTQIGSLTNLNELYLNYNQLTGSIPTTIGNMVELEYLYLRNNQLSGTLPTQLGSLVELRHLSLLNNQFSGSIPSTIGGLTALNVLDVTNNSLSGEIPSSIGSLVSLTQLTLDDNAFTGTIPSSISSCTALTIFTAETNLFSGLPNSILSLPVLVNLNFNDNELKSAPDFSTHVNKANLSLSLRNNRLDFGTLEMFYNKGLSSFYYNPQKTLDDISYLRILPGGQLSIPARNAGVNGTIAWERKVDAASSWTAVNSFNEDATQKTYTRTPLQDAHVGFYRFKLTNSVITGFTITSTSIPVRIGYEVAWTNKTGVTESQGILTKTASAGYGNAGATSTNLLAAGTDGAIEFIMDQSSTTSNFTIGFITTTDDNQLATVNYGLEINTSSGLKVYAHESNATGVDLGTWVVGDYFKIARVGTQIRYYKNGTQIRSVSNASTLQFKVKAIINNGKTSPTSTNLAPPPAEGAVPDVWETAALKDMYDSLGGSNWTTKTNWPTGTWSEYVAADYGTWYGITVSNGDITEIILPGNNLVGKLPQSLKKLTKLTKLRVNHNGITRLPSWLNSFPLITEISLNNNAITNSTIPSTITSLTALTIFDIGSNSISGTIPTAIGNLKNLTRLGLGPNQISGTIPALDSLKKLTYLHLGSNWYSSATLPSGISNMPDLTYLNLNGLGTGTIPVSITSRTKLKELHLSPSGFTGAIPAAIGNLVDLEVLNLSMSTALTGSIPSEIGNLTKLKVLDLGQTLGMSGSIPAQIGNLTELTYFSTRFSNYSGALPSSIGNLTKLKELYLQSCNYSGALPASMGNLTQLTHLYLFSNAFSGEFPQSLGNLTKLKYLHISSGDGANKNHFTGSIPASFSNMKDMILFRARDNNLGGDISFMGGWKNLTTFDASSNNFTGAIPSSIGRSTALTMLDLSSNNITGVADSILYLPVLTFLGLADNDIAYIPNFANHVNKANLNLFLGGNRLDYNEILSVINSGVGNYSVLSFNTFGEAQLVKLAHGEILTLTAEDIGPQLTVSWEKRAANGYNEDVWESASEDDEDPSNLVFKVTDVANMATQYRYKLTHAVHGEILASMPFVVSVGYDAVWNNLVGVEDQNGHIVKTASAGWNNGLAISENVLPGNQDGWVDIIFESNEASRDFFIGLSSDETFAKASFASGLHFLDDGFQIHLLSEEVYDAYPHLEAPWVARLVKVGNEIAIYENAIHVAQMEINTSLDYKIKIVINEGSAPLVRSSFWIPASRGTVPDAWELSALKAVYDNLGGPGWTNNGGWPPNWNIPITATEMDNFYGVSVANGDVTGISLPDNNAIGHIPSEIAKLKSLKTLDLSSNQVEGTLPSSLTTITTLETLQLNHNQIGGSIPTDIGNLTNLKTLGLGWNAFRFGIPTSIGALGQLELLWLNENNLGGVLPASFYDLTNLVECYIFAAQLEGSLSEDISNLSSLVKFQANNNQLSGSLPLSLGSITTLEDLNLQSNDFTGSIPESWKNLTAMKHFWVGQNSLSGELPAWIGAFTELKTLFLGINQFAGEIPPSYGHFANLTHLYLPSLNLSGQIPASFENLNQLQHIDLSFSNVEGAIPLSLISKPTLKFIVLTNNRFTSLPDISSRTDKATVHLFLQNNKIQIPDLERYYTAANTHPFPIFELIGQTPDVTPELFIPVNKPFSIEALPGGVHGVFLWERLVNGTWTNISSQNESSTPNMFEIAANNVDRAGTYRYTITNTWIPGLVINSGPITVHITDAEDNSPVQRSYNGLITSVQWRTDKPYKVTGENFEGMYVYTYDEKYQILDARFGEDVNYDLNTFSMSGNKYRLSNMSYDANGNIKSLRRHNKNGARTDDFSYHYKYENANGPQNNQLESVSGYVNTYAYNERGQMISEDKVAEGADQYVDYDVTGKVIVVYSDQAKQKKKVEYLYDDRGFRLAKKAFGPNSENQIVLKRTTWYIRDASGNILNVYEEDPAEQAINLTEVPIYASTKIGTFYPNEDNSAVYEITDHLGNVRALLREDVSVFTATMEDTGEENLDNPRVEELQYFQNITETELGNVDQFLNHTPPSPQVPQPDYAAYLDGTDGRTIGPAIALKVNAKDVVNVRTYAKYKEGAVSSPVPLANVITALTGSFAFTNGLESIAQASDVFTDGFAAIGSYGWEDEPTPRAFLAYILFDENFNHIRHRFERIDEDAGFEGAESNSVDFDALSLNIDVDQPGYLYVYVTNESPGSQVWFDDLTVSHTQYFVSQATDYETWGGVLREQKTREADYRFEYQGQFAEKDEETGWNHFELREYDAVIGRWTAPDPMRQFWSPYVGMSNIPVSAIDPSGGYSYFGAWWRNGFSHDNLELRADGEWGYYHVTGDNYKDGLTVELKFGGPMTIPEPFKLDLTVKADATMVATNACPTCPVIPSKEWKAWGWSLYTKKGGGSNPDKSRNGPGEGINIDDMTGGERDFDEFVFEQTPADDKDGLAIEQEVDDDSTHLRYHSFVFTYDVGHDYPGRESTLIKETWSKKHKSIKSYDTIRIHKYWYEQGNDSLNLKMYKKP